MSAQAITPMDKVARENLRTSAMSLGVGGAKRGDLEVLSETVSGVALILLEMMGEELVTKADCAETQDTIRQTVARGVRRRGINIHSKWFGDIEGLSGVWFGALAVTVLLAVFMFKSQYIVGSFYPQDAMTAKHIVEMVEKSTLTEEEIVILVDRSVREYGEEQKKWLNEYLRMVIK